MAEEAARGGNYTRGLYDRMVGYTWYRMIPLEEIALSSFAPSLSTDSPRHTSLRALTG